MPLLCALPSVYNRNSLADDVPRSAENGGV